MVEMQKSIDLDPNLVDAYYTFGITLWQQGEFPEAVKKLKKAIELKPDYAEAYYTLGTVLKQMNQLAPDAAAALREAIRLQPTFAGAHTTLAAVLRQMGDTVGCRVRSAVGRLAGQAKDRSAGRHVRNEFGKAHARRRRPGWRDFAVSHRH